MRQILTTTFVIVLFGTSSAFATPEYTAETTGMFPAALDESSSDGAIDSELNSGAAGYYIWNTSATDWHVRWTADTPAGSTPNYFAGSVTIFDNTLQTSTSFQFESGADFLEWDNTGVFNSSPGVVGFAATNTCCWDGFDFYLNEGFTFGDEMRFDLYSDIWDISESGGTGSEGGLAGRDIYISSLFNTPDVEIVGPSNFNGKTPLLKGQSFEITVPEPGTLALLGLGLAGLGAARRRQN